MGADVKVLAGVTIGENFIVAAGSVVTKDVPANMIADSTPAKVIREIKKGRRTPFSIIFPLVDNVRRRSRKAARGQRATEGIYRTSCMAKN